MAAILVIDDDAEIRLLIKRILETAGYAVITSENGNDARALVEKDQIGLIVTDILMPEKEGIETIVELRKTGHVVPIIAISGGGRSGLIDFLEVARKFGANTTLRKPFTRKQLLEAVRELVGEPPAAD